MSLDAKEEWIKLNRRVNLAYYIGKPAVAVIAGAIGDSVPETKTIGIDVDNDGVVDKKVTLKK